MRSYLQSDYVWSMMLIEGSASIITTTLYIDVLPAAILPYLIYPGLGYEPSHAGLHTLLHGTQEGIDEIAVWTVVSYTAETYIAFHWARELVFTVFTRLKTAPNPPHRVMKSCLQVVNWRKIVLPLIPNMADDGALIGKQIRNLVLYY